MPELTWQSIVDELRSLRIDDGLDPTLRLTALKAGASGRLKGLTRLYTSSQKRMHFNRASALQLLLQGLEQVTGIRVSQAVPVKEMEVLEDQQLLFWYNCAAKSCHQEDCLPVQEVTRVTHNGSYMEGAARREKRRREAEERALKVLEAKRQRQLAAKDAGVIFHEHQHDADGEGVDEITGGSSDGDRVGADGADRANALDGRAEFSGGANAGVAVDDG
eukprot:3821185-Pleurochrysis_carterae.AAC.1